MTRYDDLLTSIKKKEADVSIIGLGYIGLPTALFYAMRGLKVKGIDTNHLLIEELKKGLRLNPSLTDWSKEDTDLDSLREEPDYQAIYADQGD